jgi:hypothetical protein
MPSDKRLKQTTLRDFKGTTSASTSMTSTRGSHKRKRIRELGASDCRVSNSERKSSSNTTKRRKHNRVVDSSSEDNVTLTSDKGGDESDTDRFVPVRTGKRRRMRLDSSGSELDPVGNSITKASRRFPSASEEEEDLEEELDKDSILPTRFRARGKMTAFQKNLEKLKRRKLGKLANSAPVDESCNESESNESDDKKPIRGAKPHDDHHSLFGSDDDGSDASSDFIVEDNGNVPQSLPAQFSMQSHQDLSHQFKTVFQFFLHIAVRAPAERHEFMIKQMRDEEYFSIPLRIIRRKLMGLRDSMVASSVWRPEFKKALEKYPRFELIELDYVVPGCDACHLGGRKSKLIGRLSGYPYDALGFETTDQGLGSDEESNSTKREFNLGRFCAKRTRVYHQLTHWEYRLFKCIQDEVDDLHAAKQSKGFIRVAYAGRKRPPTDLGDADGICEWLDERKIIDMEWQHVKDVMESSLHLEMFSKDAIN